MVMPCLAWLLPRNGLIMQSHSIAASPRMAGETELQLNLPATGFVRQPLVLRLVPFSRSTLWRRVKAKAFPAPVKLSEGITAWRAEDIRQWISEQGVPR